MKVIRVAAVAAIVVLAASTAACDDVSFGPGVRGSGNVVTETRDVSGFDVIELETSGDVTVTVTGTESVTIEAEDNIIPLLTTNVEGGRLVLGAGESISPTTGIDYTITVASLTGVQITGSGDVDVAGVDAGAFEVEISGSGSVEPTGSAGELSVEISGSGNYAGEGFVVARAQVRISGSGNVIVNAAETLDATISGSGDVSYLGTPSVTENITGSGNVSAR